MAVAVARVDDQDDRASLEMEIRYELARGLRDTVGQSLPSVLLRLERLRIDGTVDAGIQEELASVRPRGR